MRNETECGGKANRLKRPNVIIVSTHDSGRHFGCYGVETVQTPNIDRFASEAILFEQMFAASPYCTPSRGALLTGRYPQANGLIGLTGERCKHPWELNDYHQHLSQLMQDCGYDTAMFGLQHETQFIERLGFDSTAFHGTGTYGKGDERSALQVAADAAAFLKTHKDGETPFYLQIGFFETHTPYDFGGCTPDDSGGVWIPPYTRSHDWSPWNKILAKYYADPADRTPRHHIAAFQGALRQVDQAFGIILNALEQASLAENTLVLFTTDHGPEFPGAKWKLHGAGLGIAFV
ncbi:MAG: sulfatase-like hydrolase/transferase, partial [Lentisphaerae bacterium]|nr:sulfatase-like hydrolase/transferase [Lentisphaerota bacterium]